MREPRRPRHPDFSSGTRLRATLRELAVDKRTDTLDADDSTPRDKKAAVPGGRPLLGAP